MFAKYKKSFFFTIFSIFEWIEKFGKEGTIAVLWNTLYEKVTRSIYFLQACLVGLD